MKLETVDWTELETSTHQDHVIKHVLGATVLGWLIAGEAAHFLYLLNGEVPTPEAEKTLDVAYVIHADHGMNASTFSARVTIASGNTTQDFLLEANPLQLGEMVITGAGTATA